MNRDLELLESLIGYYFKDRSLLIQALTHPSYSGEAGQQRYMSNQRLEFLGDAVLELAVSDYLYREHPTDEEGELTRKRSSLVFETALNICARNIRLGEFILLGVGETQNHGYEKPSILSDAFEALIGAIYIDGGYDSAVRFIDCFVVKSIDELALLHDSKSLMQKYVQQTPGNTMSYDTTEVHEGGHVSGFRSILYINGEAVSDGLGQSKKQAEQSAAANACRKLGIS